MFHNSENAKQVLKGLKNPDSQYRYDNIPCDCNGKIDELTKRIEKLEKAFTSQGECKQNAEPVTPAGVKATKYIIDLAEKIAKNANIFEAREKWLMSLGDKSKTDIECRMLFDALCHEIAKCIMNNMDQIPIEHSTEWKPEIGKTYFLDGHIKVILLPTTPVSGSDETAYFVYNYKTHCTQLVEHKRLSLKEKPATFNEKE